MSGWDPMGGRPFGGGPLDSGLGQGKGGQPEGDRSEDAQRFEDLLGSRPGKERAAEPARSLPDGPAAAGDSILRALMGATPPSSAEPPASKELGPLVERILERVLVSDSDMAQPRQVHLHLKDSVLAGTEIRLIEDGERLVVKVLTSSAASHALVEAQLERLRSQLSERLKRTVEVELLTREGEDDEEAAPAPPVALPRAMPVPGRPLGRAPEDESA
jgi:type III secretion system needle length determinant